jgi:hypothetical protein
MTSNNKWNLEGSYAIRSCPDGPKYGKNTYFGYFGRHQVHMNFQPSPPPHVATPAKVFTRQKLSVTLNLFLCLKKLFNKLIFI